MQNFQSFTYKNIRFELDFMPENKRIYTVKVYINAKRGKRLRHFQRTIKQAVFVYDHLDLFINRLKMRYDLRYISEITLNKIRQDGYIVG